MSFDRPYGGDGAGDFIGNELPLVALAERLGLPVSYATDIDLHADPALLRGARALISLGHDEYWSSAMRLAATSARDDGMNIAFLGANAVFRHIRLAQTQYGDNRLEICYKRANEDPLYHKMNREVTVDWREPPTSKPESVLTGVYYESNPVTADMVIVDMNKQTVITNETTYTKVGWTPYHDRKVKGVPVRTIVRGKTVMLDGKIVGKPGDGQLVKPLR